MDVTPPQTPPAIVSSTQQETVDALQRLVATQAWLTAQQRALPALPANPEAAGREAWLDSLEVFWQQRREDGPGGMLVRRIDLLATRLASIMRDEALVRRSDGTLDAAAANLVERFARAADGNPPPGVEARSLRIGADAYAGAVIVLDRADPSLVLRFLPDRGWDSFDSLGHLHAETETHLRQELAIRRELPGMLADDTEQVVALERFVDSSPIPGDVFRAMARRVTAVQKEKVASVWPSAEETDPAIRFTDDATWALDLNDKLDIFAMLVERESRLASDLQERRLAHAPADVAHGWRDAMLRFRQARLLTVFSARQHGDEAPLTLAAWTRKELTSWLADHRIEVNPDDVQVEVTGSEKSMLPGAGTPQKPSPVVMSLADFSLRNTAYVDGRSLRVVTAGRTPSMPGPSVPAVRQMARELNLAPRFDAYLREKVGDTQGQGFRTSTMRLQQARMRLEAASARLASYLGDASPGFIDDHEERGYRMVEAVLDAPEAAARATVGNHRVAVRQLVYRGAVIGDVLVIGVRDVRSSPRVVLYTPGAPDGRTFREFSDRETAAREFLYAPAFQEYLLRRLPAEFSEPLANGSGRRFLVSDATRKTRWVLSASSDGRGTITEERFEERLVDSDIRAALFDAEVVRQARDVAWLGRSTVQADIDLVASIVERIARGIRGPGSAAEDTLGAVGQAMRATWRFYDSIKARDNGQAFVDFTEAYTASLSVTGWVASARRGGSPRLSLRPGGISHRSIDSGVRLSDARQWLDPRYATGDVELGATRPDAFGVHRVDGRRYIRQHERIFEVRHDPSSGTWRLARPHALDALFPGPAIEPVRYGGWRLRTDIGLRGGWVDQSAFPQPRSRGITADAIEGLSDFQNWTLQQSLAARLRNGAEASRIIWDVTSQPGPRFVTLRQRTAWNGALQVARSTPTQPLPVGTLPGPGAAWRILPPNEWPTHLWHYPAGQGMLRSRSRAMMLPLQAVPGSGLTGLPVTAQAPAGTASPSWIRLNLAHYRGRLGTADSPGIVVIEDRRGPQPTYVVQPAVGFPVTFLGLSEGDFTAGGWRLSM